MEAKLAGQANDKIVQDGHDLRLLPMGDACLVFAEGDITSIMQTVLNPQWSRVSSNRR